MPTPAYMLGLLGQDESLAPNLGLLSSGHSPITAALAAIAAQKPQVMRTESAVPAQPRLVGAPTSAPMAPPPAAEPPPSAPPKLPGLFGSPLKAGLTAGGIAALEAGPGSAYTGPGPVIAAALKAGLPAYLATKQANAEADAAGQQDKAYRDLLKDPAFVSKLRPDQVRLLRGMSARLGLPLATKLAEAPTPNIDPLSPEGVTAKIATKAGEEAVTPHNVDPNSPAVLDRKAKDAEALARLQAQLRDHGAQMLESERFAHEQAIAALKAKLDGEKPPKITALQGRARGFLPTVETAHEGYDKDFATGEPLTIGDIKRLTAITDNPQSLLAKGKDWLVSKGLDERKVRMWTNLTEVARGHLGAIGRSNPNAVVQDATAFALNKNQMDAALAGTRIMAGHDPESGDDLVGGAATKPEEKPAEKPAETESRAALRKWYTDHKQPIPDWLKE